MLISMLLTDENLTDFLALFTKIYLFQIPIHTFYQQQQTSMD